MKNQEDIVKNYIQSYNEFDISGMLSDMDERIVFENINNGQVDLRTVGIRALEQQAQAVSEYFQVRHQEIESWEFMESKVTINIRFKAVLAKDLSTGLKKGNVLELKGRSEFIIENGKILQLRDYSVD